jgi:hypothetical protein
MTMTPAVSNKKETDALLTTKSALAKLLATENIRIVHDPRAKTAGFDVKNRVLLLPVWEGVTVDLYDLFVGHEVGHAKYTREDEWGGDIDALAQKHFGKKWKSALGVVHNVLNILEDPRIEKLMKRLYPGLTASFARGYAELWSRDFFGQRDLLATMPNDPAQVKKIKFLDRVNMHFKAGHHAAIYFSEDELPIVERIAALETWEDVRALADELIADIKDKLEDLPEQPKQPKPPQSDQSEESDEEAGDGESMGESDDSEESEDEGEESDEGDAGKSDAESAETDEESEDGNEGEGADSTEEGEEANSGKSTETEASSSDEPQDGKSGERTKAAEEDKALDALMDELSTKTDKALAEAAAELATDEVGYFKFTLPKPKHSVIVHDYKRVMEEHAISIAGQIEREKRYSYSKNTLENKVDGATRWVTRFRTTEKKNISYMVKEFDLKKAAASHAREMSAKSGRLDMSKLHAYKYSDDLFRRNLVQNKGQSHGLVFLLDFSGSMSNTVSKLMSSIISMTLFCRQVNIPFDVYLFTDGYGCPSGSKYGMEESGLRGAFYDYSRPSDLVLENHRLRNILSSRMSLKEFNQALINARLIGQTAIPCEAMGGTPLLSSLFVMRDVVEKFKATHKLDVVSLFVMTDGDANPLGATHGNLPMGSSSYGRSPKSSYVIVEDPITRKEYAKKVKGGVTTNLTSTLVELALKMIKETSNCNTIGYFMGGADNIDYRMSFADTQARQNARAKFYKEGYVAGKQNGYDEYFLISPRTLESNQEKFSSVSTGADDAAAEFARFNERKGYTRSILKGIVNRICSQGI